MNAEQKVLEMIEKGGEPEGTFLERHIGPRSCDLPEMLQTVGVSSLADLVDKTVPPAIRLKRPLSLPAAKSERAALAELREIASKNKALRSYIGLGFHDAITPAVIQRNILENPGWYTQYTPYQAEISQGRLEALVNFQTMICDMTGLEVSNASLLDEGTAAAEAMMMCYRIQGSDAKNELLVSAGCHRHVIEVVEGRAEPIGVQVVVADITPERITEKTLAVLLPYPTSNGEIVDWSPVVAAAKAKQSFVIVDADLLSLCVLAAPGEWGADIVIGNSQRFGVPLGFGGPHAAFLATKTEHQREMPGRLVGVSRDSSGRPAYRLSLQTREQHIRRDKATSNICTAQVLLAIMASMYAVYHGPNGLKKIAERVRTQTSRLASALTKSGYRLRAPSFFDTLCIECGPVQGPEIVKKAIAKGINLRAVDSGAICVSLNETVTEDDLRDLAAVFGIERLPEADAAPSSIPSALKRTTPYLQHPVFNTYHSETEFLRYVNRLQSRDLSLAQAMIPLGSCTMKLNATSEMIPVTWGEFGNIHPFAPADQSEGYRQLAHELESMLAEITGLPGVSLQPNSGSQGEYAGLLVIRAYHKSKNDTGRDVCLIPTSAHGTNPATASMAGMKVVTVACDDAGNVDLASLEARINEYGSRVAAIMVTYPSTHGVFEETIVKIVSLVHGCGGLVYMDGANMNAQVGLCRPGDFGVDVCHLNLHKTFCIPHGGGGPGVGPIACSKQLTPFLPRNAFGGETGKGIHQVTSAPWGSAGILVIPWMYIRMMGAEGLKYATELAILNANYVASRLESSFPVLYRGKNKTVAHECILDLRNFKRGCGVEVADVAKRLMDYGFHAPTVSFPVAETLMVEPTESESKEELDRFCDAMISIRNEIREIEEGRSDRTNNVLKNAPHTALAVCSDEWNHPYSRESAAYPAPDLKAFKFWPAVGRIDNAWGDRNLFCTCVPVEGFDKN